MAWMKIKRGYLYLANLNPQKGTESGKVRPVLVIQSDKLNSLNHPSTLVLPCTTRLTDSNILRVRLPKNIALNDEDCDVMIDQSRTIYNRRFKNMLGVIPNLLLKEVERKFMLYCDILNT